MDINWAVSECGSVVRAKSANILVIVLAVPYSSKNTYVALSLSRSIFLFLSPTVSEILCHLNYLQSI